MTPCPHRTPVSYCPLLLQLIFHSYFFILYCSLHTFSLYCLSQFLLKSFITMDLSFAQFLLLILTLRCTLFLSHQVTTSSPTIILKLSNYFFLQFILLYYNICSSTFFFRNDLYYRLELLNIFFKYKYYRFDLLVGMCQT